MWARLGTSAQNAQKLLNPRAAGWRQVYDATRHDNEERSAVLLEQFGEELLARLLLS